MVSERHAKPRALTRYPASLRSLEAGRACPAVHACVLLVLAASLGASRWAQRVFSLWARVGVVRVTWSHTLVCGQCRWLQRCVCGCESSAHATKSVRARGHSTFRPSIHLSLCLCRTSRRTTQRGCAPCGLGVPVSHRAKKSSLVSAGAFCPLQAATHRLFCLLLS